MKSKKIIALAIVCVCLCTFISCAVASVQENSLGTEKTQSYSTTTAQPDTDELYIPKEQAEKTAENFIYCAFNLTKCRIKVSDTLKNQNTYFISCMQWKTVVAVCGVDAITGKLLYGEYSANNANASDWIWPPFIIANNDTGEKEIDRAHSDYADYAKKMCTIAQKAVENGNLAGEKVVSYDYAPRFDDQILPFGVMATLESGKHILMEINPVKENLYKFYTDAYLKLFEE